MDSGEREQCVEFTQVVKSKSAHIRQIEWLTYHQVPFCQWSLEV